MRPEVEEYVKKKEAEIAEKKEKKEQARRNKILVDAGFYEIEYQQSDSGSAGYPYWDPKKSLYYKMRTIDVSDEEFREIEKFAEEETQEDTDKENVGQKIMSYAKWIRWIGIIASVIGAIAIVASDDDLMMLAMLEAAAGAAGAVIASWFVYAFGQFVDDTHRMRKIMDKETKK